MGVPENQLIAPPMKPEGLATDNSWSWLTK
jgi:hypothetical protein